MGFVVCGFVVVCVWGLGGFVELVFVLFGCFLFVLVFVIFIFCVGWVLFFFRVFWELGGFFSLYFFFCGFWVYGGGGGCSRLSF